MKKDNVFYQSKFEHYRVMNMWVVIASCISSLFYVISDWYLFGEINTTTVPARMAILIPFVLFMIVNAKVRDYRVIVPLSYLIAHSIMWCTIWACVYLPDLTFASDGFIIIMSIFIFFGFAAPGKWSIVFTGLIFDIDFFKKVNDTYGHEGGDVVLKEVVDIISAHLQYPNYMLRWGGEEFLVIMQGSLETARQQAEEIRMAIEQESGKVCPVTISIGVTKDQGGDYNTSVRLADEALYRAKESGRNRVCIS